VEVYSPLGLGRHVDHRLTRRAAEQMGRRLWYFRDLPYDIQNGEAPEELVPPDQEEARIGLASEEIDAWTAAAGEYHSQIQSFWSNFDVMASELREYHDLQGGIRLLRPPPI
jgi:hypothetical protein